MKFFNSNKYYGAAHLMSLFHYFYSTIKYQNHEF